MAAQMLMAPSQEQHRQASSCQSLEVVLIFFNAATACIAHTRELIPWTLPCFQTRHTDQLQFEGTHSDDIYSRFCQSPVDGTKDYVSQEFRILRRGYDSRADHILNMIEHGIADALKNGFLDGFQLIIATDPKNPVSILEAYTFSISYADGNISQITLSSGATDLFVVHDLQHSFASSIKALLRSMNDLPRLPRHRFLGISLLYSKCCPPDYQAPGFQDINRLDKEPLRNSWAGLWQASPAIRAEFTAGMRSVKVGTRSLQFGKSLRYACLQDTKILANIQQMQKTSSQNKDLVPTTDLLSGAASSQAVQVPSTSQNRVEKRCTNQEMVSIGGSTLQNESNPRSSCGSSLSSGGCVKSTHPTLNSLANLCVGSKNRRRRNVVVGKLAELLVQARALESHHQGPETIFDPIQLQNGRTKRLDRSFPVRCECSSHHETEQMLQCELCGTKQHKTCYGYELLRLGCLPEEHFCYNCLLLPREPQINESMPEIVHMRLALQYLSKQTTSEVKIDQAFVTSIFPEHKDHPLAFVKVIDRLTNEGYLGQRRDGFAPILDNNRSAEARTRYLDPLAGISHHYQIVRDGDTFGKRKNEVFKALKFYVGNRSFSLNDVCNSHYDQLHVKDNVGQEVVRWGFYANWKRKRCDTSQTGALRQKVSVSNKFVTIHRHASSEATTVDEVASTATNEASWHVCSDNHLNTSELDLA